MSVRNSQRPTRRVVALAIALLSIGACATVSQADLGKPFDLNVGESRQIRGSDLVVRFTSVTNDSRCPSNVTCIWAGNAAVALESGSRSVTLNTSGDESHPSTASIDGFAVRLVTLEPYPAAPDSIDPRRYVARLVVTRP